MSDRPAEYGHEGLRTHTIHDGWGHHVEWFDGGKGIHERESEDCIGELRVWGHLPSIPKVGDRLTSKMQSGRVGVFEFVEVDQMSNPLDMFFAWVKPLGYEDEVSRG